jgi:hypothetical protein
MTNISENGNGSKPDLKEISITTSVSFGNLPTEDSTFDIEASEKNSIKTCKKLRVSFTRVYVPAVYGSKSKKLSADKNAIAEVDVFLRSFYNDSQSAGDDEDTETSLSYEDWKNQKALQRVQILLSQRARIDALRTETADVGKQIAAIANSLEADKVDIEAIERLEAMLNAAKAKMKPIAA